MKTTTRTTTTHQTRLSRKELLKAFGFPADADLYVEVPGGGDWSSEQLGIDEADGLRVSWTTIEDSESTE